MSNVHCKACGRNFDRLEWLKNKECDMPEKCHCPEVKKAMQQANRVINQAKGAAGFKVEKTVIPIRTDYDEEANQLEIKIEPLVVIDVKKVPRRGK